MKIWTISDLHIDYSVNHAWFMNLSRKNFTNDLLILAGDISNELSKIEKCFEYLTKCFKQILYVPGNHDLWVLQKDTINSFDKWKSIFELTAKYGIITTPHVLKNLTIVPLFSWYDFSFGPCSDYLKDRWMDFYKCRWGRPYDDLKAFSEREKAIADYFHALNEPHLKIKNKKIISFSHFMPRIDVMPEHIPTVHQKVYPVLGSWALDKQIRTLGSVLHIYGHSHVNRHELIEGVTYVNNAYGNPGEESIASKQLKCLMEI